MTMFQHLKGVSGLQDQQHLEFFDSHGLRYHDKVLNTHFIQCPNPYCHRRFMGNTKEEAQSNLAQHIQDKEKQRLKRMKAHGDEPLDGDCCSQYEFLNGKGCK